MANDNPQLSDGTSINPSAYQIYSLIIYDKAQQRPYELKDIVGNITIHESIFSLYFDVEINIIDGVNLFETLNITGSEDIFLHIGRKERNENTNTTEDKAFQLDLKIVNISNYDKSRPGVQFYTFNCVSPHVFQNLKKRLTRPFNNTPEKLIHDIVRKDLKTQLEPLENNKRNTNASIKGIYPHTRPLETIRWLLRNMTQEGTPTYLYGLPRSNKKLTLASYADILKNGVYRSYKYAPFSNNSQGLNFEENQSKILSLSSDFNVGQYQQLSSGSVASTLETLDIHHKKYTKHQYDVSKLSNKLNDYTESIDNPSDYYSSVMNRLSLNTKAFGDNHNNYHDNISPSIVKRNAYIQRLGTMNHNIRVYGDFLLSVGRVVELNIQKSIDFEELDTRGNMIDNMLSGNFLITALSHSFSNGEYIIEMACQKDSFNAKGVNTDV